MKTLKKYFEKPIILLNHKLGNTIKIKKDTIIDFWINWIKFIKVWKLKNDSFEIIETWKNY